MSIGPVAPAFLLVTKRRYELAGLACSLVLGCGQATKGGRSEKAKGQADAQRNSEVNDAQSGRAMAEGGSDEPKSDEHKSDGPKSDEHKPDESDRTEVCFAPLPELPPELPEEGRGCVEKLVAGRSKYKFGPPAIHNAPLCGVDEFNDADDPTRRGSITRSSAKKQTVVFDGVDEDGFGDTLAITTHRNPSGQTVRVDEVFDQFSEGENVCRSTERTTHDLDARGWPRSTKRAYNMCEGRDVGTYRTTRLFKEASGFVEARIERRKNKDDPETGSGWWLPDPADPVAWGTFVPAPEWSDRRGDVECWLEVRACDGTVLGRMYGESATVHGAESYVVREVQRHVWDCESE